MQQLLGSLPGLSPGLRDPSSPQYEVGMSFAIGHTMQNSLLDLEPDRVAADAAGVLEKLELSGHGRKARRLAQAFAAILKQEDHLATHLSAFLGLQVFLANHEVHLADGARNGQNL